MKPFDWLAPPSFHCTILTGETGFNGKAIRNQMIGFLTEPMGSILCLSSRFFPAGCLLAAHRESCHLKYFLRLQQKTG